MLGGRQIGHLRVLSRPISAKIKRLRVIWRLEISRILTRTPRRRAKKPHREEGYGAAIGRTGELEDSTKRCPLIAQPSQARCTG